jgi:hypothetical protein
MPSTYEPIATQTLGSSAGSVTFASIPSTYTDLVLVTNAKVVSGSPESRISLNSDTGNNYSYTILSGSGTAGLSTRVTSSNHIDISYYGVVNSTLGNSVQITNFLNYSNTTTYKTVLTRSNNAGIGNDAIVGLWRATAAINRIFIENTSSSFDTGSTFTLYGIKAA